MRKFIIFLLLYNELYGSLLKLINVFFNINI